MKRKIIVTLASLIIFVSGLYLWATFTHTGRVMSLYAFGGLRAPVEVKIRCAQETDNRVEQKFTRPLAFDEASKNALREFWHFSYYRECLFEVGYDFGGNRIPPATIVKGDDDSARYTNYFGGISFLVPNGSVLTLDNATDPDIEDRRLTSQIVVGENILTVLVYRNYDDIDTMEKLQKGFLGFSSSTGSVDRSAVVTNTAGIKLLSVEQADGLTGLATINPQGQVIQIFGSNLPPTLLEDIRNSLIFSTPGG